MRSPFHNHEALLENNHVKKPSLVDADSPTPGTGVPGAMMGLLMKVCWATIAGRFLSGGPPGAVWGAASEVFEGPAGAGAGGGRAVMGPGLGATTGTGRGVTILWRSSKTEPSTHTQLSSPPPPCQLYLRIPVKSKSCSP